MAAAFATYLGPYSFTFRREMLTVHWPQCLDERGVMLVVDSSAPYAGAEVFVMEKAHQAPTSIAEPAAGEQEVPEGESDENANEDESRGQDEPNGNVSGFCLVIRYFVSLDSRHQGIEIGDMKSCQMQLSRLLLSLFYCKLIQTTVQKVFTINCLSIILQLLSKIIFLF